MSLKHLVTEISKADGWESLNKQQQSFCITVLEGRNIFLTGSAGVGKSFALNFLFNFLTKNSINYGKTATTGVAALNFGGSTIHSWAGIGLADTDMPDIFRNVFRNKKACLRIAASQILFIDEISMASGKLINIIDKVFKAVRRDGSSFGGIQMVFSGDFLQLPPVFKDLEGEQADFAFNSDSWKAAGIKAVKLTEIVRQKNDKIFANLLEEVRFGITKNVDLLNGRIGAKLKTPPNITPIRLFGYNAVVDKYNQKVISSMPGKAYSFYSKDTGEKHHIDFFNRNCQAAQKIDIKVGAQVMLIYNVDVAAGLVNGSVGKVIGIEAGLPLVDFGSAGKLIVEPEIWEIKEQIVVEGKIKYKVIASRTQIPLKVAFACSYHKAQGTTLDYAIIDLQQAFADGMAYVGLSRVKNLDGLSISSYFNPSKIKVNPECLRFYEQIE